MEDKPLEVEAACGTRIRLTACLSQGGRRYMEDAVRVECKRDESGAVEYVFIGVFDGHGGLDASKFAKERLLENIVSLPMFKSENDADILEAIRVGFSETHHQMWKEVDKWPKTASGYTSTAGTTASVAFIKNGKLYTGHVGDSAIVLGEWEKRNSGKIITSKRLTIDHKPDSPEEWRRIESAGGEVQIKAGVHRVVWMRPRRGHQGAVRRSTLLDKIPFLAVARSLGDLWSYNGELNKFVVSPEPDLEVVTLEPSHCCLIFGSDGLWNVLRPQNAVEILNSHEWRYSPDSESPINCQCNHARLLVRHALLRWGGLRADNITAIAVIFDPPSCQYAPVHPRLPKVLKPDENLTAFLENSVINNTLIHIDPTATEIVETSPVELVYYGQVDPKLPDTEDVNVRIVESMPVDTNEIAPDSPNVVITTEFIQATSAVSVHIRKPNGTDSPCLANENSDQVVPPDPVHCSVEQRSTFHLIAQSSAVDGDKARMERKEITSTSVFRTDANDPTLLRLQKFCNKNGVAGATVSHMNNESAAVLTQNGSAKSNVTGHPVDVGSTVKQQPAKKLSTEAEIPTNLTVAVHPNGHRKGDGDTKPTTGAPLKVGSACDHPRKKSIFKGFGETAKRLVRTRSSGPNVTGSGQICKDLNNQQQQSSTTHPLKRERVGNRSLSPHGVRSSCYNLRSGMDLSDNLQPRVVLTRLPLSVFTSVMPMSPPVSQGSKPTGQPAAKTGVKQTASKKLTGVKNRLNKLRAEVAQSAHKFRLEKLKHCVKKHLDGAKSGVVDAAAETTPDSKSRRGRSSSSLRNGGVGRTHRKLSLRRSLSVPKSDGLAAVRNRMESAANSTSLEKKTSIAGLNLENPVHLSSTAFLFPSGNQPCLHRQSALSSDWCHCRHSGTPSDQVCSVLRCVHSPPKLPPSPQFSQDIANGGIKRKVPAFDDDFLLISGSPTSKVPRYRSFLESRLSMTVETFHTDGI